MSEKLQRIEDALRLSLRRATAGSAPPRIGKAMLHAVFPGGQRIRPRLTLAVAKACGDDRPALSSAAAAAVELLHCASLVHDDMPCFDDAAMRRGRPSVQAAFGEALALLAGDALIVLAFETAALAAAIDPLRGLGVISILARAVGMPAGIVAGQAFESEPAPNLLDYQRAKTGALFAGATSAGAASAGHDPAAWSALGFRLGEAYQLADDLRDVVGSAEEIGKPTGQDRALGRPNAVAAFGLDGAVRRLIDSVEDAAAAVPDCAGAAALRADICAMSRRFLPKQAAQRAA